MKKQKGTILVTTLWIVALLVLLALGIGVRLGVDIKLIGFALNASKAHYLAEAGLRKTMALLESDSNKNIDSLNEIWSSGFDLDEEEYVLKDIEFGEGTFTISHEVGKDIDDNPVYLYGASDEDAKLNINKIDGDLIARLPNFSEEIAAAVTDWRDGDDLVGNGVAFSGGVGAEDGYYKEELENPYECRNASFSVPEELMLVKGVTEDIYDGVKDIISVYGESKAVNINTASEEVLAVLVSEGLEALPAKIIEYRNGDDGEPGTEDDKIFKSVEDISGTFGIATQLFNAGAIDAVELEGVKALVKAGDLKVNSNTFRIVSRGSVKEGRVKKTIEAVIRRDDKDSRIIYYYED